MWCFAIAVDENLIDVLAFEREYLHALAAAVGDVDESVIRHARRMDGAHELLRASSGRLFGGDALVFWNLGRLRHIVERFVAEGTPHAFERAGIGIEHDDAFVAVSV